MHNPATAHLLIDILYRCRTGDARIKGLLPLGTDDAGHVVPALFVKQETKSKVSERAIAQIARAVYDYFLFTR